MDDVKDIVYSFISDQVTLGNIKKNDKITEQFLVDNLGISRTPIREALLQLAAEGVIEREPRKGFRLKNYNSKADVENLYELIGVLDGKIAELALPLLNEQDLLEMRFLIDSMYSAINNKLYNKYHELQEQFHNIYINKISNKVLKDEICSKKRNFIGKAYSKNRDEEVCGLLLETNKEHELILDFIVRGDGVGLRGFLEVRHWARESAKYDIW